MPRSANVLTPLWKSIAATLRSAIADGQYPEGSRLPTEADLAARFGVNRHTVRHALATLIEDGLVHSRRGSGTFVLSKPLDYPLSERVRFHRNLRDAGRLPGREILAIEVRTATEAEARRLSMTPGDEICVAHTLSFADHTPIALAESHFPEARHPGFADALRSSRSVTDALATVGVADYLRTETRLSATIANATQASHLRLPEGAPLLLTESRSESDGVPVEWGQTWFASDRVTLTFDFQRDQLP
ncbi:GntR family transcriptional regulator [Aliiruegeria haliotis]|uniref:GntR family transcriptional regulator n=1 Tax=Aliiruegeria haliotis TaxID=1280846 RepID=A0A2T0RLV5_9RHOB|nr:phosphonate metabolism transcriptional regulator PhnF [Aliiruegeria haliotis]PRY22093.1 GntR family transcriptional regulator [Aliiruegeria haliotis]